MYAIVDIKGKQFKVQAQDTLYVPLLADVAAESTIEFKRVLLLSNTEADSVSVGRPVLDGASVEATVLGHVKADKIIVFKKKRRKRYRVRRGHRQRFTKLRIDSIKSDNSENTT